MPINQITIKNFKSLKDVTLHLKDINLLIGPNNSGKTNFFRALKLLSNFYNGGFNLNQADLVELTYQREGILDRKQNYSPMSFQLQWELKGSPVPYYLYQVEFFGQGEGGMSSIEFVGNSERKISKELKLTDLKFLYDNFYNFYVQNINNKLFAFLHPKLPKVILDTVTENNQIKHTYKLYCKNKHITKEQTSNNRFLQTATMIEVGVITDFLQNIEIFAPEPSKFQHKNYLQNEVALRPEASNLLSYLYYICQRHPKVFDEIEDALKKCIPEFEKIKFPIVSSLGNNNLEFQLHLIDINGISFKASDLSEGTLYFLALLAIVFQPNPSKLILLEEPEKGIHPRRIAQVIKYIQQVAHEKGLQIIITSHSPIVVNEFAHDFESVSVIDKNESETVIKNLQRDILKKFKSNKSISVSELEDLKRKLGEFWLNGFLGGVPNEN